jgi:hypothetical protein
MATSTIAPVSTKLEPAALSVVIRLDKDGPEATREPVRDADLDDARSELWLAGCLRKGHPEVPFEDMPSRLIPLVKQEKQPRCCGFVLETTNPSGVTTRCEFSMSAVSSVAIRAANRLLQSGIIEAGDRYFYEVVADTPHPDSSASRTITEDFKVKFRKPPLRVLPLSIQPLLNRARTVGEVDDRWYHVFYTEEALNKAERLARKGGVHQPPQETGAVLVGPLCSCPQRGDLFSVVCDALEVLDAEQTQFSLTYSGKSWSRILAVMNARQAQPTTQAHRILGQCHGHNFAPADGAPPCEMCSKLKVCTRTSVFVSPADRTWSRATFSRQPWQLCHIFGLNARNEQVHTLFGLRDGDLTDRGFHIIPEFRPEG